MSFPNSENKAQRRESITKQKQTTVCYKNPITQVNVYNLFSNSILQFHKQKMNNKNTHCFSFWSCILLIALVLPTSAFNCTEEMYADYLTHWSRNITAQQALPEYTQRFNTYCTNRAEIDQTNSQNLGYQLDIYWQWMDKSEQQRSNLVRIELAPQEIAAMATPLPVSQNLRQVELNLPTSLDWRTSNDVSSIKNQGSCGCCWSFTTAGLYESWMMVKGEQEYDLSQEYILECTTKFTQNVKKQNYTSTCNGGYVDFSGELARVNGIPSESDWPYKGTNYTGSQFPSTSGICSANKTYMYAHDPSVTTFNINRNNTNLQMKTFLAAAPVGVLIYANTGFQAYKSGVYTGCPSDFATSYSKINHAVVIVGYDSSGNYIVKNSWGTSWGQNGFGVVSATNDCAISAFAYTYNSNASAGTGVLYYNQVNLEGSSSGLYLKMLSALLVLIMTLFL